MLKKAIISFGLVLALSNVAQAHTKHRHVHRHHSVHRVSSGVAPQAAYLVEKSKVSGAAATAPVLLRIFKEEHQLELWRLDRQGQFVLIHTFVICKEGRGLGPKLRAGDFKSPEGFYEVYERQLNYHSRRFLAIDTGYPNLFDKDHHRTGNYVEIHGGCGSAGCFAIENGPVQELFNAVRESFKAGQQRVQLQILPFRMTDAHIKDHQHDQDANWSFWQELKVGYDRFETTHRELDVSVINGKYIIN